MNVQYYEKTMHLLADIENYMDEISSEFECSLCYTKITPSAIVRAVGVEIVDDYSDLAEKVIDYMELVREFDRNRVFFTVNFRSYISDDAAEEFMKTVKLHDFHLVMFENKEYKRVEHELRTVIDDDLCQF